MSSLFYVQILVHFSCLYTPLLCICQFIKKWCCQGEDLRNTNHLEGWHSRINRFIGQKRPSIAKVLDILVKEMKMRNSRITRKNENYLLIDSEINEAVENLKAKEISVGHCLEIIAPFMF